MRMTDACCHLIGACDSSIFLLLKYAINGTDTGNDALIIFIEKASSLDAVVSDIPNTISSPRLPEYGLEKFSDNLMSVP